MCVCVCVEELSKKKKKKPSRQVEQLGQETSDLKCCKSTALGQERVKWERFAISNKKR